MTMLKEKRLTAMRDYIVTKKTASMQELIDFFAVSPNTLRRDLQEILKDAKFKKVYGGITLVSDDNSALVDYDERKSKTSKEKNAIGKKAASLISEGDMIFFDSGTTTDAVSKFLPTDINFTMITNSLELIIAASRLENITLIAIGNHYNRKTKSFTGTEANRLFERYNVNKAFTSSSGVSIDNGVTNSDLSEFKIKASILDKATHNTFQQNYLLIDHTKFDHTALLTYAKLNQFFAIITEGNIPQKYIQYFKEQNIRLYYAQ